MTSGPQMAGPVPRANVGSRVNYKPEVPQDKAEATNWKAGAWRAAESTQAGKS
jgi:hypothetical protein